VPEHRESFQSAPIELAVRNASLKAKELDDLETCTLYTTNSDTTLGAFYAPVSASDPETTPSPEDAVPALTFTDFSNFTGMAVDSPTADPVDVHDSEDCGDIPVAVQEDLYGWDAEFNRQSQQGFACQHHAKSSGPKRTLLQRFFSISFPSSRPPTLADCPTPGHKQA
jgi:hypothetical protein